MASNQLPGELIIIPLNTRQSSMEILLGRGHFELFNQPSSYYVSKCWDDACSRELRYELASWHVWYPDPDDGYFGMVERGIERDLWNSIMHIFNSTVLARQPLLQKKKKWAGVRACETSANVQSRDQTTNSQTNKPSRPSCCLSRKRTLLFEDQSPLPGPPLKMASNPSPEVKAILIRTHDLMLALSNEPVGVAGILLGEGFVSEETMSKMLIVSYTPNEKATILIEAVRNKIALAPERFPELLEILSKLTCAQEVVKSLRSTHQSELAW